MGFQVGAGGQAGRRQNSNKRNAGGIRRAAGSVCATIALLSLAAPASVGAQPRLDGLAVSGVEAGAATGLPLFPAFAADATVYAANARTAHATARIAPTAASGAITIDGVPVASGAGHEASLADVVNAFAIVVDTGATSTTYQLNITRLPFRLTLPAPTRVAAIDGGVGASAGWRQPVPLSATTLSQQFLVTSPFGARSRDASAWADIGACAYAGTTVANAPAGGVGRWCPGSLLRPYYVASGPKAPIASSLALTRPMIDNGGLVFVADSGSVSGGPEVAEWVPVRSTSPNLSDLQLRVGSEELALNVPFDHARTQYRATTGSCARLTVAAPTAQSRVQVTISPADADRDALGHQVVFAAGDGQKVVRIAAVAETGTPIAKNWEVQVSADPDAPSYCGRNPPDAIRALEDRRLDVGESLLLDLDSRFRDVDGDALTYTAVSSHPAIAPALARDGLLRVWGASNGTATIDVVAEDSTGLMAEQSLAVVVGHGLTVRDALALEGGTARVRVELEPARRVATTFRWQARTESGSGTASADAGEHADAAGEATIAAGATSIEVEIPIADDADIEAARESFTVAVEALDASVAVQRGEATVTVLEGVCDRTAALAEALSEGLACEVPTSADLAGIRQFRLRGRGLSSLARGDLLGLANVEVLDFGDNALAELPLGTFRHTPEVRFLMLDGNRLSALSAGTFMALGKLTELRLNDNDLADLAAGSFSGLSALRFLRLDGNALRRLPAGVFTGLAALRSLRLDGNPGAPFVLPVQLLRTDAEPHAPGPARLRVSVAQGTPFDMTVGISAAGGLLSRADGSAVADVFLAAGETRSASVAVRRAGSAQAVQVALRAPSIPATQCNNRPCWRGLELAAGAPLLLFARPPTAATEPRPAPLFGDSLRLPLESLFNAGNVAGELSFRASSSDDSVALVQVDGDELVVTSAPFAEGTAQVEVVATDAAGLSAVLRFDVQVQFFWPVRHAAGWRGALGATSGNDDGPRAPSRDGGP